MRVWVLAAEVSVCSGDGGGGADNGGDRRVAGGSGGGGVRRGLVLLIRGVFLPPIRVSP